MYLLTVLHKSAFYDDCCFGQFIIVCCVCYADLLINSPMSCYLYALGPDCCTLASCDSSEQCVIYTNYLSHMLAKFPDVVYDLLGCCDRQFADRLGVSVEFLC